MLTAIQTRANHKPELGRACSGLRVGDQRRSEGHYENWQHVELSFRLTADVDAHLGDYVMEMVTPRSRPATQLHPETTDQHQCRHISWS